MHLCVSQQFAKCAVTSILFSPHTDQIPSWFSRHAQDVMQQATNAILRGGTIMTPSVSAKTIAEQLAEKINAKLNYTPVEKLEEERQAAEQAETVKRYEEELEINDFPQVSSTQCRAVPTIFSRFLFYFSAFNVFPYPR